MQESARYSTPRDRAVPAGRPNGSLARDFRQATLPYPTMIDNLEIIKEFERLRSARALGVYTRRVRAACTFCVCVARSAGQWGCGCAPSFQTGRRRGGDATLRTYGCALFASASAFALCTPRTKRAASLEIEGMHKRLSSRAGALTCLEEHRDVSTPYFWRASSRWTTLCATTGIVCRG